MGGDMIGSRIAKLRKKAGLTQERFAEAIGKSRSALIKIENDETMPKADTLIDICLALNISPEIILFDEKQKTDPYSEFAERANRLDQDLQTQFYEHSCVFLTGLEKIQETRNENVD